MAADWLSHYIEAGPKDTGKVLGFVLEPVSKKPQNIGTGIASKRLEWNPALARSRVCFEAVCFGNGLHPYEEKL